MSNTLTKLADSKGRVTLGSAFAGKTVLIEEVAEGEVHICIGKVIPQREAWLYANEVALGAVRKGLQQARELEFVNGPNLIDAKKLADQIEDD